MKLKRKVSIKKGSKTKKNSNQENKKKLNIKKMKSKVERLN